MLVNTCASSLNLFLSILSILIKYASSLNILPPQAFNRTGNGNDLAMELHRFCSFFFGKELSSCHLTFLHGQNFADWPHKDVLSYLSSIWLQQTWNLQTLHANIAMMPRPLRGSHGWQGTGLQLQWPPRSLQSISPCLKNMRPAWIFEWNTFSKNRSKLIEHW